MDTGISVHGTPPSHLAISLIKDVHTTTTTHHLLQLREVAMATTFWLLMGYNFSCMTASDMLFDSIGVGFRGQAIQ